MVSIIAKFRCDGYRVASGWGKFDRVRTVDFSPVYSEDPNHENKKFWEATPSGKLEIGVANEAMMGAFDVKKEYYVIITDKKPEGLAFD